MRSIEFALLLLLSLLLASPAFSALRKFDVRAQTLIEIEVASPRIDFRSNAGVGTAVIDETGPSPILKRFVQVRGGGSSTISAPTLSGFIFLRGRDKQGPTQPQTGTGSTSDVIEWGDVTGWTISGGQFCHSVPSTFCDLAMRQDSATVSPELLSTHYDIRAFIFHGTGFVGQPWVFTSSRSGDLGNTQYIYRGPNAQDGTVPALPLLGVATVGLSVVALGISAVRRKRS